MSDSWYVLNSGPAEASSNMALDEALFEAAARLNRPILRFYGWTEPAATFGYAQRFSEVSAWTHLRPLIRRTTGGGLVPHDADWTYSLVFPPDHGWYRLKAGDSYRRLHEWISRAFALIGIRTQLSLEEQKPAPGRCFLGAEKLDVLWQGAKIAGAAQRRNRLGLLIQGSVQPPGTVWPRKNWERAMLEARPLGQDTAWEPLSLDPALTNRADLLAREKYSQAWHNQRR